MSGFNQKQKLFEPLYRNRHLRYTRTLYTNFLGHDHTTTSAPIDELLPWLAPNSLRPFDFDINGSPSYDQMQYLWRSQKSLKIVQLDIGHVDDGAISTVAKLIKNDVKALRSLKSVTELDLIIREDSGKLAPS